MSANATQGMLPEMWLTTFNELDENSLRSCCQVSKEWHVLANNDVLWQKFPGIANAARACMFISGDATAQDIQQHIIEFIDKQPLEAGQIGRVEVAFAHVPGAYIVFWMGEGCECSWDRSAEREARNYIVCDPEHTVGRRYVVLTDPEAISQDARGNNQVSLPNAATGGEVSNTCGALHEKIPLNRRNRQKHANMFNNMTIRYLNMSYMDCLPARWYYTTYNNVLNWDYDAFSADVPTEPFQAICRVAHAKIDERDDNDLAVMATVAATAADAVVGAVAGFFSWFLG